MRVVVAAEAITANWLGKRFFDFFPQARTSTSQRVRAIFFEQIWNWYQLRSVLGFRAVIAWGSVNRS
jgi:hypothetical protein